MIGIIIGCIVLIILIKIIATGRTYYMSTGSFREQFGRMDESMLKRVEVRGPRMYKDSYMAYPIEEIQVTNKKGDPATLKNGPAIEIRFTDTSKKRTIFYFDTIQFDGENITGSTSRFIKGMGKTIPLSTITKIEVQNGGKRFKYVNS